MNDGKHDPRRPPDGADPFIPGLDDDEPLEFLNKEPADMSDDTPRDDQPQEETFEATYDNGFEENADESPPPRRRGLAAAAGTNRVMIATGVVVVVAAALIFWPRGGSDLPAPVGEQFSVVAADSGAHDADRPERPRSSDVNLSLEAPSVVPETPEGSGGAAADSAPASSSSRTRAATGSGEPGPDGKWAIQLGSFGSRANARSMAAELSAKGFRVETPTLQTTTGGSQTKVWIAYFETHAAAKAWAAAHVDEIGGSTYITHR